MRLNELSLFILASIYNVDMISFSFRLSLNLQREMKKEKESQKELLCFFFTDE